MESRPENAREEVFATSSTRRSLFTPGGPPARAVIGSDADRTVRLKTGIVLPYNPNTAANNNKIVEDCFKRCLVKGRATEGRASKGQSKGTRHSGLYVTDVGAQPDRATCDPRAVLLCGGGHEEATYIRNISPLTHLMVGGGLADIIDCVSEGALKMLRDSSDLHKAWQWQEMLRTVVVRCFSLEYIVQVCCACAASLRKSQVACMLQETSAELTLEGFHRFGLGCLACPCGAALILLGPCTSPLLIRVQSSQFVAQNRHFVAECDRSHKLRIIPDEIVQLVLNVDAEGV